MTTTRRAAQARGNVFKTVRTPERDVWNLHDVFLTASLLKRCMEESPVSRPKSFDDVMKFFATDRSRAQRAHVAFLYVLVEAWHSASMQGGRDLVLQMAPGNAVVSTLRLAKRSGALAKMKDVRDYMFHRDQREYWDGGRVALVMEGETHRRIYEAFSSAFLIAMPAVRKKHIAGRQRLVDLLYARSKAPVDAKVQISHPLSAEAASSLAADYPAIAGGLGWRAKPGLYPNQIHRLIDGRYDPSRRSNSTDLGLIESACSQAEPTGQRALRETDAFKFLSIMSELRAWDRLRARGLDARTLTQGASSADILISGPEPTIAIEVYSPSRPLSVKQLGLLFGDKLKYLKTLRGYVLTLQFGPEKELPSSTYWPERLCDGDEYRVWEASFLASVEKWLSTAGIGDEARFPGPGETVVRIAVNAIRPAGEWRIAWSWKTHSVDWHTYFERSPAISLSQGAFGRKLGDKLRDGQALKTDAGLRVLLVDVSMLDSAYAPNQTPEARRTLEEIFILVGRGQTNYDGCLAVDFAKVDTFGPLVWFNNVPLAQRARFEEALGLIEATDTA